MNILKQHQNFVKKAMGHLFVLVPEHRKYIEKMMEAEALLLEMTKENEIQEKIDEMIDGQAENNLFDFLDKNQSLK